MFSNLSARFQKYTFIKVNKIHFKQTQVNVYIYRWGKKNGKIFLEWKFVFGYVWVRRERGGLISEFKKAPDIRRIGDL